MRVGHPPGPQAWAPVIGPLGAWGDELSGRVGQHCCGGVGAGDSDTLAFQGRDDLAGPGGVPPAPVLLEPGVSSRLARSLQLDWGGSGGDGPPGWRRVPGHGLKGWAGSG